MPRRTPPTREDVELADQVVERNRAEAVEYLEQCKSRLPGDVQARVLDSEHVVSTLHELVEQERIDLVFLSAHGYSGQTRWPYGGIVVSFIAYGTTPLLIVQDVPLDKTHPLGVSWGQSTPVEAAAKEYGRRETIAHGE
jgi:nucleotide-binding universal stress UspA family protein